MRLSRLLATPLALCLALGPASVLADEAGDLLEQARTGKKNALELTYKAYREAEPDYTQAVEIPAKKLDLAWGSLELSGGYLVPIAPAEVEADAEAAGDVPESKWIGAVYIGGGKLRWEAPNKTQEWLLGDAIRDLAKSRRGGDLKVLEASITDGALLQLNGRWRDLLMEGSKQVEVDSTTEGATKKLIKARGDLFDASTARSQVHDLFEGEERGFFLIDLATDSIKKVPFLTYIYDPDDFEPAILDVTKRYALNKDSLSGRVLGRGADPELVSTLSERELARAAADHTNIDVQHYNLDATVRKDTNSGYWGMDVTGDMRIKFTKPTRVVDMDFITGSSEKDGRPVHVKYLNGPDGEPLQYLHTANQLIIQLDREYDAGEEWTMSFQYDGNWIYTLKQPSPQTSLEDTKAAGASVGIITWEVRVGEPWYPSVGIADRYTFDWNLRLPKPMLAATSGTLLRMSEEDGYHVHVIKEQTPETLPAIVFGRFSVTENDPDYEAGEHKIRLYTHPGFERDAQSYIDEAQSILSYYETIFGDYPFSELDMAQMAIGLGFAQAPAGIVRVTGEVYISKTDLVNLYGVSDFQLRDYFIPHEIAHEWWGHKADFGGWESARDQWISETFAEYAAALYVEAREAKKNEDLTDTSGYENRKQDWKRQRRGHKTDRTAPLWTGQDMGGDKWQATVYARGPLLLDYIRRMYGREKIVKVMYTFVELANRQDHLTLTEDFQACLEQVIPEHDWKTFIADYVKGNREIPDAGAPLPPGK